MLGGQIHANDANLPYHNVSFIGADEEEPYFISRTEVPSEATAFRTRSCRGTRPSRTSSVHVPNV